MYTTIGTYCSLGSLSVVLVGLDQETSTPFSRRGLCIIPDPYIEVIRPDTPENTVTC